MAKILKSNTAGKRIVSNTLILYGRMAITVFMSLYTTRLTLDVLGVTDFGIFNLVAGAVTFLSFINTSMTGATQRFMSYAHGEGSQTNQIVIFNVAFWIHIAGALILFLVAEILGTFLLRSFLNIGEDRQHASMIVYHTMSLMVAVTIASVPYDAVINARENMVLFAITSIIESFFKLLLVLFIAKSPTNDNLVSYGVGTVLISIITIVIKRVYCHRNYEECKISFSKWYDRAVAKSMLSFAGWNFFNSGSSFVVSYSQGIILNKFFGSNVNAAQGISNQVSGQLGAFAVTMQKAVNPMIDKLEGSGDRHNMHRLAFLGSKTSLCLMSMMHIPAIVMLEDIFSIWLNEIPPFAIVFTRLLLCRFLVEQLFSYLSNTIQAVGNVKSYSIAMAIVNWIPLLVSIGLFLAGYSPLYLYLSFLFGAVLKGGVSLYYAQRLTSLSISSYVRDVIIRCVSFLLCLSFVVLLTYTVLSTNMLSVNIIVTWAIGLFVSVLGYLRILLNNGERHILTSILSGITKKLKALKM